MLDDGHAPTPGFLLPHPEGDTGPHPQTFFENPSPATEQALAECARGMVVVGKGALLVSVDGVREVSVEEMCVEPVTMAVHHACGHRRAHEYASREVAEMDRPRQCARKCPECRERPK